LSDRKDIWPVGSNGDVCVYACSVESTALHLIMGLGSWEVQPQLSRIIVEPKSVVLISNDSEELNRAMILTLARAVHVTGTRHTVFSFSDSVSIYLLINTKNCSLSIVLMAMDQKPQKSLKR